MFAPIRRSKALVLSIFLVSPCISYGWFSTKGNGQIVAQSVHIPKDIKSIEINGEFLAHIEVGPEYKVSYSIDQNLMSKVSSQVADGHLKVSTANSISPSTKPTLKITFREIESLKKIELRGSVALILQPSKEFSLSEIHLNGSSRIDGKLATTSLQMMLSGSNTVKLEGRARQFNLAVSGSNMADFERLKGSTLKIDAHGSNHIVVGSFETVEKKLAGSNSIITK